MQQDIDFPMEMSVIANLMKNTLAKVAFLNDQNTLLISPSHFWLSHVKDYHFVQSNLVGSGFLKA